MSATTLHADFSGTVDRRPEQKWSRRQSALFLVASSGALWALILLAVGSLL